MASFSVVVGAQRSGHPLPTAHLQRNHVEGFCELAEQTWLMHVHPNIFLETIRSRFSTSTQTSHSRRPYASRSSRINAPSSTSGNPSGGRSAFNGSRRTLGSPCRKAFSPSAGGLGWGKNLHHNVDGRHFWSGDTTLDFVDVRVLESMYAPSCFCNMSAVCFLPAQNQSGRTITLGCF